MARTLLKDWFRRHKLWFLYFILISPTVLDETAASSDGIAAFASWFVYVPSLLGVAAWCSDRSSGYLSVLRSLPVSRNAAVNLTWLTVAILPAVLNTLFFVCATALVTAAPSERSFNTLQAPFFFVVCVALSGWAGFFVYWNLQAIAAFATATTMRNRVLTLYYAVALLVVAGTILILFRAPLSLHELRRDQAAAVVIGLVLAVVVFKKRHHLVDGTHPANLLAVRRVSASKAKTAGIGRTEPGKHFGKTLARNALLSLAITMAFLLGIRWLEPDIDEIAFGLYFLAPFGIIMVGCAVSFFYRLSLRALRALPMSGRRLVSRVAAAYLSICTGFMLAFAYDSQIHTNASLSTDLARAWLVMGFGMLVLSAELAASTNLGVYAAFTLGVIAVMPLHILELVVEQITLSVVIGTFAAGTLALAVGVWVLFKTLTRSSKPYVQSPIARDVLQRRLR